MAVPAWVLGGARVARGWRAWHWPTGAYLFAGAIFIAVYFGALSQAAQDLAYQIPEMVAPIAIVLGVLIHRPQQRRPWLLLAGGIAATASGDWLWVLLESLGLEPVPSVADAFYLAGMLLTAAAVLGLLRGRIPGGDRAALIDAAIVAIGAGLLSWTFVMAPQLAHTNASIFEISVALAYPVLDILLLAILVRLILSPGRHRTSIRLLVAALTALLLSDFPFAIVELVDGYQTGSIIELGWLAAPVLWGAAAIHPSMRAVAAPAPSQEPRLSWLRLAMLAAASLMAPTVLVIQWLVHDSIDVPVIAAGSAILFLLVIARLAGVVGDLRRTLARRHALEAELEYRAEHDSLTGLANTRSFYDRLDEVVGGRDAPAAVLFLDLDNFKSVNDTFGHQAGDEVLCLVASALKAAVRASDTVGRIGGDEFAILIGADATVDVATQIAKRVLHSLSTPLLFAEWKQSISVSVGIAVTVGELGAQALLSRADLAMYEAKRRGKGTFVVFDERMAQEQTPAVTGDDRRMAASLPGLAGVRP
jgi:diguanylate cyclase (GGDEF)-like protein